MIAGVYNKNPVCFKGLDIRYPAADRNAAGGDKCHSQSFNIHPSMIVRCLQA